MNLSLRLLAAASLCALASGAHAALVTVDFDGLDGGRNALLEVPANFYDGGLGSFGSGPGPDYGITFTRLGSSVTDARAICNVIFNCDGGAGNSLFILGDMTNGVERGAVMHIEGGFRGIVEFDASISNLGGDAFVSAKTGLSNLSTINGTYVDHPDPSNTCGRLECDFYHYSFDLADDPFTPDDVVAHVLIFRTFGTDAVFIDNIRFHDLILPDGGTPPVAVPEPASLALFGATSAGLLGLLRRRKRKTQPS